MRYFANPSTPKVRDAMSAGLIDVIITPKQGNRRPADVPWCADNGCFGAGYPGDEAWFAWLESKAAYASSCVFAVAPDVVGDAVATLTRSVPWLAKIRKLGFPAALVAQNGLEQLPVPWDEFDALFIGGCVQCPDHGGRPAAIRQGRGVNQQSLCDVCGRDITANDWKESDEAAALVAEAKRRGKWVHMGRVNSGRRLQYAQEIGCDSADGTYLAFGPDVNLPKLLGWLGTQPAKGSEK